MSMFPIPQSRFRSARVRFSRSDTAATSRGRSGWWMINARLRDVLMSLAFSTDVLKEPVKISGQPVANLIASTSGTDSDWVVKVIDVYPDEVAAEPKMGGYQLMVSADIFRGRYRESLETPKAIASDKPLLYRFTLPTANHVFLPGHRIMVQVQSSWFPLYDRNPQTFVPEYLLGQTRRLQEGCPAHLSLNQPGELRGVAAR